MSIELNWETLTTGPDGEELAHRIRDFIHSKFQTVPLPRFIKSVTVHDFQFGAIPPELELKDITDPLPDFYEEDPDADYDEDEDEDEDEDGAAVRGGGEAGGGGGNSDSDEDERNHHSASLQEDEDGSSGRGATVRARPPMTPSKAAGININTRVRGEPPAQDLTSPFLGVSTPGILSGGTSNFSYFHSHLASSGLSGTQTPLAAVAGAQLGGGGGGGSGGPPPWSGLRSGGGIGRRRSLVAASSSSPAFTPSHSRNSSTVSAADMAAGGGGGGGLAPGSLLREKHSVSTLAPTSVGTSRPPTRDPITAGHDGGGGLGGTASRHHQQHQQPDSDSDSKKYRERRIEDLQAVFRIRYAGDVKLLLTADILLDYPMPSFVGIPVRLGITGLTFDGVGVVAHIRKRVHFCFLGPEDALAAVGSATGKETGNGYEDGDVGGAPSSTAAGEAPTTAAATGSEDRANTRMGGLLQEIRVESEIGQRNSGKQSLKNVGKVEKFILEQVRRIFEEEFVYPSFWTFLV